MRTDPDTLWDRDPDEEQDEPQVQPPPGLRTHEPLSRRRRRGLLDHLWKPRPIERPTIDAELESMPWPERCAEAICYAFLLAEHWLSRQGVLREWLRLNVWVGVALLAAALLIVPPVTLLLEGVAGWAGLVQMSVSSITATVLGLPPIVIAISSGLIAAKLLSRSWQRRKRRPDYPDQHNPYD